MSGALGSVRDFSPPALCGHSVLQPLAAFEAAERCGFSGLVGNPRPRSVGIPAASLWRPVRDFMNEIFLVPPRK